MPSKLSRRKLLLLSGLGIGGYFFTRPVGAIQSLNLGISDASATTSDGTISRIDIDGTSSLDFSWEGFDTNPEPTFTTEIKATDTNTDLDSAAKTYEPILQSSYLFSTLSGTQNIGFPTLYGSETFPVDILTNHSGLDSADFVPSSSGNTKVTELRGRLTANTPAATSTTENTFSITVEYLAGSSISGVVSLNGTPVENATVYIINTTTDTLVATIPTNSSGEYSAAVSSDTYHVTAQYDNGTYKYSATSKPYITP